MKRQERLLHHKKMDKIPLHTTIPKKNEGSDGDLRLCRIESEVYLMYKDKGIWVDISGRITGLQNQSSRRAGTTYSGGTQTRHSGTQVGFPSPNYDSGWQADGGGSVSHVHNLGSQDFKLVQVSFNNAGDTSTSTVYNTAGTNSRAQVATVSNTSALVVITDGLGYHRLRIWI